MISAAEMEARLTVLIGTSLLGKRLEQNYANLKRKKIVIFSRMSLKGEPSGSAIDGTPDLGQPLAQAFARDPGTKKAAGPQRVSGLMMRRVIRLSAL